MSWTTTLEDAMVVTAPTSVPAGSEFEITMAPGEMQAEDADLGRLKYDLLVPRGADLLGYELVGAGKGLSGESVTVMRVGSDGFSAKDLPGVRDEDRPYLRLTGRSNQVIWNGPGATENDPRHGVFAARNAKFQFPAVKMRLRARSGGSIVTTGIRTGELTARQKMNETSISYSAQNLDKLIGFKVWNGAAFCVANGDGRKAFTTTEVYDVAKTTTSVQVEQFATTGKDVHIDIRVVPNPGPGTIELYDNDRRRAIVALDADGHGTASWMFEGEGIHTVVARFLGTKTFAASESPPQRVAVTDPLPTFTVNAGN